MLACLLCLSLCASLFVFSASAEATTFSNSNLTYGDYELNHTGNLVSTTISIVTSGSSRVFVLKSSSYANFGFLQLYNKNSGFIFKNPSQYPARFSLFLNTYTGSSQTVTNYQHSLTAFINGGISAGVNLIGRDSQVSKWEIYYEIPAGIDFHIDSIDISCSFPAQSKTCEFWIKSPTLTYKTDGEYVVDGVGDKIDEQIQEQKNMFQRLLDGILNGLKNLFIPSDDFFQNYLSEMNQWLSDHFGALYYPIDLFIDVCGRLLNLEVPENPSITLPAFQVGETVLLPAQTYSFDMSALPALGEIHSFYLTVVDVIIALWLCGLAAVKLKSIMGG